MSKIYDPLAIIILFLKKNASPILWSNRLYSCRPENIEPLLQKGCGFTVKDITSCMDHLSDTINYVIYNQDVKILDDHYGDRIQFAPYPRRNESKIVFSSNITVSDLAVNIRNLMPFDKLVNY